MTEMVVAARAPAPAAGRWGAAPPQELLERLKDYGQEGAFAFWDELGPEERDHLIRDIEVSQRSSMPSRLLFSLLLVSVPFCCVALNVQICAHTRHDV
jgi:hypothetical protein